MSKAAALVAPEDVLRLYRDDARHKRKARALARVAELLGEVELADGLRELEATQSAQGGLRLLLARRRRDLAWHLALAIGPRPDAAALLDAFPLVETLALDTLPEAWAGDLFADVRADRSWPL